MPIPVLYAIFLHKNVVKCLYQSCLYIKNEKDIEFWIYFIFINTIIITITAMPCCKFSDILFKIYYIHIILNSLYFIIYTMNVNIIKVRYFFFYKPFL